MKKQRKHSTPGEKAGILRRHLLEKKIQIQDEAPAEPMAERIALRRCLGNSDRGLGYSSNHAFPQNITLRER